MAVRFQRDIVGVDWQELISLFKLAGLGGREGDKVRRAFENSTVVCFAFDGPRLVGRHARRKRRTGMGHRFAMTAAQPVAPESLRVQLT